MTRFALGLAMAITCGVAAPLPAFAQLTAAADAPIVYGHHHVNATSLEAHRAFWIDGLGGTAVKLEGSTSDIVSFPNVLVFFRAQAPEGGTKGTVVNHVGFQVPDLRPLVEKLRAAGHPIVTKAEVPATYEEKDGLAFVADQDTYIAFVMGPDETKVELSENKALQVPIALHHVHFYTPDVEEMRAWYVKVFSAKAGMRGSFQAADLPGVNLTYSASPERLADTRGRALDHIGFEVDDLKAFLARVESLGVTLDRPYTVLPASGVALAFFTDPWGTYIEVTEGLDRLR